MKPCRECITREELKNSSRSQINDEVVMHLASMTFGIGTYQVIGSAMMATTGYVFTNHVDRVFDQFWHTGRIPTELRNHIISTLVGEKPMIIDEDGTEAALLA